MRGIKILSTTFVMKFFPKKQKRKEERGSEGGREEERQLLWKCFRGGLRN